MRALLLLVILCAACVNVGELREDALRYRDINQSQVNNAAVASTTRVWAQLNADAWAVQAWELGGPEPSEEAKTRIGLVNGQ